MQVSCKALSSVKLENKGLDLGHAVPKPTLSTTSLQGHIRLTRGNN